MCGEMGHDFLGYPVSSFGLFHAISCSVHSPSAVGVPPIEPHWAKQSSCYAS